MNEWTGKLSRIDAIMIIERATDKEDPAWLWSVEDWYDEDTDTWPSIYHVMAALDVTESEYREATGAQNLNWPDEGDSELTTLVRQLAEREKTEQDLWEKLNCQDNEIDDLKRQLEEAQEKEKAAKDLIDERNSELTHLRARVQELEAELEGFTEDVQLPDIEAITRCRIRVRRIKRLTPPEDKSDEQD